MESFLRTVLADKENDQKMSQYSALVGSIPAYYQHSSKNFY